MKIIKPSYEILKIKNENEYLSLLEKIIRICYKSEDRITEDSKYDLISNIVKKEHWAMLEHINFTFRLESDNVFNALNHCDLSSWMKFSNIVSILNDNNVVDKLYKNVVTLSIRSLLDMLEYDGISISTDTNINLIAFAMIQALKIPMLDKQCLFSNYLKSGKSSDLRIKLITIEEKLKFNKEYFEKHNFLSIKFIVDRGISHELVRHRCAVAQESTRYCCYTKDKFNNELTFIEPCFFNYDEEFEFIDANRKTNKYMLWKQSCKRTEELYIWLIENGSSAQEARSVLNNSLKTEVVLTMNFNQWKHFFDLRTSSAAHPQMREITIPLYNELSKIYSSVFKKENINNV